MRAALLIWLGQIEIGDVAEPEPGPDEVRIAVGGVGLCGSDLSVFSGKWTAPTYPWIQGHEAFGRIDAVGDGVSTDRVGEIVVIEPNIPCLDCPQCARGVTSACVRRLSIGMNRAGALAREAGDPERQRLGLARVERTRPRLRRAVGRGRGGAAPAREPHPRVGARDRRRLAGPPDGAVVGRSRRPGPRARREPRAVGTRGHHRRARPVTGRRGLGRIPWLTRSARQRRSSSVCATWPSAGRSSSSAWRQLRSSCPRRPSSGVSSSCVDR